jgi:hypothetical protein
MGGASDRGAPMHTIQWDLPGGTGCSGDEEPGGGTHSLWAGVAVRGSRLLPLTHRRGRRPREPPCLDFKALGTHVPYKGGGTTSQGHHRRKGPHLRRTLGWAAANAKWGTGTQKSQNRGLAWQKSVDGDTSKVNLFQETAGGLQEFKTYLFIKKGGAYCTVLHSPMKFMAISEATQHLQGQFIGFVGGCTVTWEPTPILLPLLKTWQWVKEEVCTTESDLLKYYQEDTSRRGKLWSLGEGATTEETTVPRLLSIPLLLFKKIQAEG